MGRILRDRKICAASAKRTRVQSHLSNSNAKVPRHALSDKTNSRGKVSQENNILPLAVTTTRSRAKSFSTSCSENDSPNSNCLGNRAKTASHARADKLECNENSSFSNTISAKRKARNPLGDKTNSSENESPVNNYVSGKRTLKEGDKSLIDGKNALDSSARKPTTMALRKRVNQKSSAENSVSQKLLTNKLQSFNNGRLCSPRGSSGSKKQTFSCIDLSSKRLSNSFVQLEDISELIKTHDENKKSAKKPIYQTISEDGNKTDAEMLPEDKIKLYEYQVDANSPKKVKVKRKRKPRKKKIVVSDSDKSNDEEDGSVRSVTKRLCTLSASSPLKRNADEADASKTNSVNPIHTQVFSPINCSDRATVSTPKNVRFAGHLPSANSTPNTAEPVKESLPVKALRFSQKEISSPVPKILPMRQIKKSIYVNPAAIMEMHSSPDISMASEVNTTVNNTADPINSPSHSLKQTKINSFFSTSTRSGNETGELPNHNDSGLFDELPCRSNSERMSTTAASTVSQFITVRRKALYNAGPRISGFERTPISQKPLPPMTIENCFGFDDANDADDTFIPPSNQYRSLPLSVTVRPVCSTPITAPQPTRICIQAVTQPVPKKTVKLASSARPILKRPVPLPAEEPSVASTSECVSRSPPLMLFDPEILAPVTFGDEPSNFFKPARRSYQRTPRPKRNYADTVTDDEEEPLPVAKKPKKKEKQYLRKKKLEEDKWATSINREFEEIEDVALVVE